MNFKKGDILQYINGNNQWVKNKYRFKVLSVGIYEVEVSSLQKIMDESTTQVWCYAGDVLSLEKSKLKKIALNNTNKPEWF